MAKQKLFIWTGVLYDYTGGMAAIEAPNYEEARRLAIKQFGDHREREFSEDSAEILELSKKATKEGRIVGYVYGGG